MPPRGTYSIVAMDGATGEIGVAVQSRYFAVGAVVPWATAGVGAVATQAAGVAAYGPRVLALLEQGVHPERALEQALAGDEGRETRQLGVVEARTGQAAAWTGSECLDWAGHVVGDGYAAQGNILAGEAVVRDMASAFEDASGTLGERLMTALEAAEAAGGDRRGRQSAAIVVERACAAGQTREGIDRVVDLRVDDHAEPIRELRRLVELHARWRLVVDAHELYERRELGRAIDALRAGLARFPDDAVLLYDLACYESLDGRHDDALADLRHALELDPSMLEMARADADLAPLRDRRDFEALVAAR